MTKFCTFCGAENQDEAGFCVACGRPFAQPVQPVPVQQVSPQPAPVQPAPAQPAPVAPAPVQQVPVAPAPAPAPVAPPVPAPANNYPGMVVGRADPGAPPVPAPVPPSAPAVAPPQPAAPPAPAPKKHVSLAVKILVPVLIVVLVTGGVIAAVLLAARSSLNKVTQADYYTIGTDRIPSVKKALGSERKVTGVNTSISNGVTTKTITFQVTGTQQNADMLAYVNYLIKNDNFYALADADFSTASSTANLGRNSTESGQQLTVQVDYDTTGYTLTLVKQKGKVTVNTPDTSGQDTQNTTTQNTDTQNTNTQGTPSQSTSTSTGDGDANGPYANPTIMIAPGWKQDMSQSNLVCIKGSSKISFSVYDLADTSQPSLRAYAQFMRSSLNNGEKVIDEPNEVTIGGLDAWHYTYSAGGWTIRRVFLIKGSIVYDVSCTARDSDFSSVAQDFQAMLESIKVKNNR